MADGTAILAQWRQLVASKIALIPLHQAMCAVFYPLTAVAIKTASKVSAFFVVVFLQPCQPPGRSGANTCPMVASSGLP